MAGERLLSTREELAAFTVRESLRAATLGGRVRAELLGRHGPLLAVSLSAAEASEWGGILAHAGELAEERAA